MKFSIFTGEKNLCILYGQVFIMNKLSMKLQSFINTEIAQIYGNFWFRLSKPVFFSAYINVTIVGNLTFMSGINFSLSRAEHKQSFITKGPRRSRLT